MIRHVVALLTWLVASSVSVFAFEVGESVVVIQDADVTGESGLGVEGTVFPGDCFKLLAVDGPRLSVDHNGRAGWISSQHVVPLDRGIEALTEQIQEHPGDVAYRCGRGFVWNEKQEYGKALDDFTEAIKQDPKNARAYYGRGNAWNGKREYDIAVSDYTDAIQLDPKIAGAYFNRGSALFNKQAYDRAISDYSEVIRRDPKDGRAYFHRGQARYAKNESDKAIADYTEAIQLNPKNAQVYSQRGQAWVKIQAYDKAIADFTEAITLDSKDARAYFNRGWARYKKQQYDEAIADFTEVVRLDPQFATAYVSRSEAWQGKRQYEKAIADYAEAIRINPNNANYFFWRGNLYLDLGRNNQAIGDYNQAIRIDTNLARAYLNRGYAKYRNGDPVSAALDWDKANQIDKSVEVDPAKILEKRMDLRSILVNRTDEAKPGRNSPDPSVINAPAVIQALPDGVPKEITSKATDMKLVLIPAGEFSMGSSDRFKFDEQPMHRVKISKPFHMGKYEVTLREFLHFYHDAKYKLECEKNGKGGSGYDSAKQKFGPQSNYRPWSWGFRGQTQDHPVVNVSWNDAKAFCDWLSKKDGWKCRLPTEAEWEYACRAGTASEHPAGDQAADLVKIANIADQSARRIGGAGRWVVADFDDGHQFTAPVGSFAPNGFGLHDMIGNVNEWCLDIYEPKEYEKREALSVDPLEAWGSRWSRNRVSRGANWNSNPMDARSAKRYSDAPETCNSSVGFRVVVDGVGTP